MKENNIVYKCVYLTPDGERSSLYAMGKFRTYYPKGEIVRAHEGSVGIVCCKSYDGANWWYRHPSQVIMVRGIGEPYTPKYFLGYHDEEFIKYVIKRITEFGNKDAAIKAICEEREEEGNPSSYQDIICYPAVEVLE